MDEPAKPVAPDDRSGRQDGPPAGKRRTQVGLTVHEVDAERNLLLVKGAVPGPKNGLVEVREDKGRGSA